MPIELPLKGVNGCPVVAETEPAGAVMQPTQGPASPRAAFGASLAQGVGDLSAQPMTSAHEASPLDADGSPAIRTVLDAMEAAEISPEDALQISLVLLNFVEEHHLLNLEEYLQDEQPDAISIAVWAADSARLKAARELVEEVLGDDEEDDEGDDEGDGADGEDGSDDGLLASGN